jgi:hypothetical protein
LPDFAYDPAYESQVTEEFLKDVPEPVFPLITTRTLYRRRPMKIGAYDKIQAQALRAIQE